MDLLFILYLVYLLLPSSSSSTPTTTYLLTCGSPVANTNPPRTFLPDSAFLSSTSSSTSITDPRSPSLGTSHLYSTARVFTSITTYNFKTSFPSTYILRLHFLPFSPSLSTAAFSVSVLNRYLLLSNFSVSPTANNPLIKEYLIWVDSDIVALTFNPVTTAFVNAIEVFSTPSDLISTSSPRAMEGIQLGKFTHQALETVYRVNVGGARISAGDELWRIWSTDDDYIYTESVAFENRTSIRINYQGYGEEIAPQIVYQTMRSMAVTPDMRISNPNFNFNLTWTFQVPNGYTYFIRMHFCDFISLTSAELYFDVYLGDLLAYPDLHPADFTANTPATAFYVDFAANPTGPGVLRVSIGRSAKSVATTANAILNGLEIMKINNSASSLDGGSFSPTNTNKRKNMFLLVLIGSIIGGLIIISAMIFTALLVVSRRHNLRYKSKRNSHSWSPFSVSNISTADRGTASTSPRLGNLGLNIPYSEIKLATNNFDDSLIIGTGGFGKVYKGVLRDGTTVAVKRGMPESKQGYPEFQTEIIVLSTIRHRHLVSLIGYCEEQSEMILVYEFMEKGTLRSYLVGSASPSLSWKQRLQICIGAARGLHYLHTGHSHNLIHRDVKSTNILLGENYLAKVSDFGLSRVGPNFEQTHVSTVVKGTFGYLDPEYFKTQKLTDKSDVYSFGVTLFEVLCGRAVIDLSLERERINLAEWAMKWQRKGKVEKIVDPRIASEINGNSLRTFGETAMKCLADYGVDRPTMGDVLWNLEYALQLQETELRREPFEDSGNVDVGIQVAVVRRLPSSTGIGEEDDEEVEEVSGGLVGVGTSDVFSQLVTDEGR